jgi:hypothetical protein
MPVIDDLERRRFVIERDGRQGPFAAALSRISMGDCSLPIPHTL